MGGGEFLLLGGANQWFLGRKGINFLNFGWCRSVPVVSTWWGGGGWGMDFLLLGGFD